MSMLKENNEASWLKGFQTQTNNPMNGQLLTATSDDALEGRLGFMPIILGALGFEPIISLLQQMVKFAGYAPELCKMTILYIEAYD